jgi:hypothetical protein
MTEQVIAQNANKRSVSAATTSPTNQSNKRAAKVNPPNRRQRPMNHGIHNYTKEEYAKLSKEDKKKLKENCAKVKVAKLKVKNAPNDVCQISAVTTTPHSVSSQSGISNDITMGYESVNPPVALVNFESDVTMADDSTIGARYGRMTIKNSTIKFARSVLIVTPIL